jgi:hypothetical protein
MRSHTEEIFMSDAKPFMPKPLSAPEPYAPRRMGSIGQWQIAGFAIKAHAIQRDPAFSPGLLAADVAQAAKQQTEAALDAARGEDGNYSLGFCIVHAGAEANWLLVHWWKGGGILCQKLFRAPLTAPCEFAPVASSLMACVWELVVINHERDAWVRHMLQPRPAPDGYLADEMPAGAF